MRLRQDYSTGFRRRTPEGSSASLLITGQQTLFTVVFRGFPAYSGHFELISSPETMAEELVLAFPRALLDQLGNFHGIRFNVEEYVGQILEKQNTRFLPRSSAEGDPEFKQIIPYVLIRRGSSWLHYVRGKASGEKRLVTKGSIGVGGHINPDDQSLFDVGRDFYDTAVQRELHEELSMDGHFQTKIVALLNDDSTPVGRVHLGVVHLCDLTDQNVSKRDSALTALRFLTVEELQGLRQHLESWSQFCLEHLDEIVSAARDKDR